MKTQIENSIRKIGYLVRFHRRERSLSQTQLADILGISLRGVQRLELGEVEPKLETLHKISDYMKISINSLLRPTCKDLLMIRELTSGHEFEDLLSTFKQNDDVSLVQHLLREDDVANIHPDKKLHAQLEGNRVRLSSDLAQLIGTGNVICNIDDYITHGSALERWEFVFRAKLNQAIMQNFYYFPNGFKVFKELHYNIKPDPDSPSSECYIRDITHRYELEKWMKEIIDANRNGYKPSEAVFSSCQ